MKTPITYYGGKQRMVNSIIPLMPPHRVYCEPFGGGAALFFAKDPVPVEVLNDTNGELINFYRVIKTNGTALEQEIAISLHSRMQYNHAAVIYTHPDLFDPVKRAWAVWMLANSSFGAKFDGGFSYDRTGKRSRALTHKKDCFTDRYAQRLATVQLECGDAVRIIKSRDVPDAFFYLDPPYVGADQGHYDGYTQEDFDGLLRLLETIKGKFLLSSYRNKTLKEFAKRNNWYTKEFRMRSSMTTRCPGSKQTEKIEVLTANYPLSIAM